MGKLADKIAYLKETCKILREKLTAITGNSYEGWSLRSVVNDIDNIDRYQSLWTHLPKGTYTDPFGEYTVSSVTSTAVLKAEANGHAVTDICGTTNGGISSYINMAINGVEYVPNSFFTVDGQSSFQDLAFYNPDCLIYPKRIGRIGKIILRDANFVLQRGLYLPQKTDYITQSDWIQVIRTTTSGSIEQSGSTALARTNVIVKCPPNTEMKRIYLQLLPMTAEVMVDLFSNLANVSGRTETYKITVGSANLGKLTSTQKAIATDKGWVLS